MPRGNWGVLLALGLVALLSAAVGYWTWPSVPRLFAYGEEQARTGQYHPGGYQCDAKILAAIGDSRRRQREANACAKEAEEYRLNANDLIQQTRAASAAEAQADIASQQLWTGWLQTLGGLLTLAAAVAAAWYARDAATASRGGLHEASEANRISLLLAQIEVRAKLSIKEITVVKAHNSARVFMILANAGKSSAADITVDSVFNIYAAAGNMTNFTFSGKQLDWVDGEGERTLVWDYVLTSEQFERPWVEMYCFGTLSYHDVFMRKGKSDFCFRCRPFVDNSMTMTEVPPTEIYWQPAETREQVSDYRQVPQPMQPRDQ